MNKSGFFLLLLLVCHTAVAASISGTVSDDGSPLSQVEVTLLDASSNVVIARKLTAEDGVYHFNVEPHVYTLRASLADYADAWVKPLAVQQDAVTIDITLTPQVFVDSTKVPPADDCD